MHVSPARADRLRQGFTFAELLAAMVFVGILLPVVVQGLALAHRASAVAYEKTRATLWAEAWLQEQIATDNLDRVGSSGSVQNGNRTYQWSLTTGNWSLDTLRLIRLAVRYDALGRTYEIRLATLAPVSS